VKHISHSSLTAADECLKKFHATRIAEEKPVSMPSGPRDIGILAHAYIEAYFKGYDDFAVVLAAQAHTAEHAEAMAIFDGWRRRFDVSEKNWLYTEREGSCNVEDVPVPIIGYDDFVYNDAGTHVLRDFKTGWGTEVYDSYSFQGDLACLRYEYEFPSVPLASEVEFVRRGIVSPRRIWSPALRAATIDRVKALWAKIRRAQANEEHSSKYPVIGQAASSWPATPGKHCTFCPIIAECAKGRRAQAAGLVVADSESALAALREVALMEEAISQLKAALKPYCAQHGDIETGPGKYDHIARYTESAAGKVQFRVGKKAGQND
jgi:hypothetical protein